MMNDTFGPMYAQPLMRYDQDTQSWRTSLDTSLWDLPMSSPTLPESGLMRNGELFERPMLERPTSATGSSSLPTPRESMHKNQGGNDRGIGTSDDYNLETVAGRIATLPTPIGRDHKEQTLGWTWERNGLMQEDTLPRAITSMMQASWGKYEPAIRRWEALTREVPEPTVAHKEKRRLNPAFVEWMMGLPAGHVTGHGLSAAKELKMLGNGVVPQQARSAVTQLMERITQ